MSCSVIVPLFMNFGSDSIFNFLSIYIKIFWWILKIYFFKFWGSERDQSSGDGNAEENQRPGESRSRRRTRLVLVHGLGREPDISDLHCRRWGGLPTPRSSPAHAAPHTAEYPEGVGLDRLATVDDRKGRKKEVIVQYSRQHANFSVKLKQSKF